MGRQRGAGSLTLDDGGSVEGRRFLDCVLQGEGVRRWAGGATYRGALDASGLPQGRGVKILADGTSVEAEWRAGQAQGRGTVRRRGGDVYEGELSAGEASGQGRCDLASTSPRPRLDLA